MEYDDNMRLKCVKVVSQNQNAPPLHIYFQINGVEYKGSAFLMTRKDGSPVLDKNGNTMLSGPIEANENAQQQGQQQQPQQQQAYQQPQMHPAQPQQVPPQQYQQQQQPVPQQQQPQQNQHDEQAASQYSDNYIPPQPGNIDGANLPF